MARRKIHCALSIEGGLRNAKSLCNCIRVDGKLLRTVPEVKNFLQSQLDLGRKLLPMDDCDNFDYQTGCKGHTVED